MPIPGKMVLQENRKETKITETSKQILLETKIRSKEQNLNKNKKTKPFLSKYSSLMEGTSSFVKFCLVCQTNFFHYLDLREVIKFVF